MLTAKPESDLIHKLKWLMFFRVLFTTLLLGSTIILQLGQSSSYLETNLVVLYGLIAGIYVLSGFYFSVIGAVEQHRRQQLFAYSQISIDTVIVTLIIYVTGSYSSIFSFLYLVVIIYSSILIFRPGAMAIAALCSIQYGVMIDLEYYRFLMPIFTEDSLASYSYPWSQVLYKILIVMAACFAVAFLSSLLSEQERQTKRKLLAMEDRVKRAEKMAAMGEMAAGLAHEIKNPLASLSGSIQLLKEDIRYDPGNAGLMQIILRETERLSDLVNNFLLFARPSAGKSEMVRLDRALDEIVSLFEKNHACRPRITINKSLQPDLWIEMDPAHLRQIMWNLLMNAAEAIEGVGRIDISAYSDRGRRTCIDIADNGSGMTRELMQTIFDPFFTTKSKGTGLGLSIVHSILESYDGQLDVESAVGEGTTFVLSLMPAAPKRVPA